MQEWTDEIAIVGAVVVSVVLIVKGDTATGAAIFTAAMGYVFGRVRKMNGEMRKVFEKKKVR